MNGVVVQKRFEKLSVSCCPTSPHAPHSPLHCCSGLPIYSHTKPTIGYWCVHMYISTYTYIASIATHTRFALRIHCGIYCEQFSCRFIILPLLARFLCRHAPFCLATLTPATLKQQHLATDLLKNSFKLIINLFLQNNLKLCSFISNERTAKQKQSRGKAEAERCQQRSHVVSYECGRWLLLFFPLQCGSEHVSVYVMWVGLALVIP